MYAVYLVSPLILRAIVSAWRWRTVVDDHNLLRLLAGEKQGNKPTDERKSEEDVDDDNSRLMRAVSLDCRDGGQEIDV